MAAPVHEIDEYLSVQTQKSRIYATGIINNEKKR